MSGPISRRGQLILSEIVRETTRVLAENTLVQLNKLTDLDLRPFTMDDNHLNDSRGKILALLKDKRYPKPTESELSDREEHIRAALANFGMIGYSGLNKDDLTKLRPTDDYETELDVMAETRAYWQVAYKVSLLRDMDLTTSASSTTLLGSSMPSISFQSLAISIALSSPSCRSLRQKGPLALARSWPNRLSMHVSARI